MATAGLLPIDLISQFIESTSLTSFFNTLKENMGNVNEIFESLNREISKVSTYIPSIESLLESVKTKFNFMKPIDNLFRSIKPWVDKAVALFDRVFSW